MGTIFYLLVLLAVGVYIIAVGPFLRIKSFTFYVVTFGSLVFTTGTGVFVTNVTSPFMVLESFPALGAMNVAIFSYFYSGFKYGVGLAYEGAPLFVFGQTAFAIWEAFDYGKEDGPVRTSYGLATAMLVLTVLWIIHSVSYRLYGYRVDWRLEKRHPLSAAKIDQQDPRFHLGAAQGHPTWRTPFGQSSSVVMTALAWSIVRFVEQDLALQQCRPDWVFYTMLYGSPVLITLTILWNIFSGTRCRKITGLLGQSDGKDESNPSLIERMKRLYSWLMGQSDQVYSNNAGGSSTQIHYTNFSKYPGYISYKYFKDSNLRFARSGIKQCYVLEEYIQAAALQGMERNSLFVEEVPSSRLTKSHKCIGFFAWFLAQIGLIISAPAFFSLMVLTELIGILLEAHRIFKRLVETNVTNEDRDSAAKVIEQCFVGKQLEDSPRGWSNITDNVLTNVSAQTSTNLHTLLDNTGPAELYNMLFLIRNKKTQPDVQL
uniref:Uncharacterized protein n=1 Tax=Physcomitrium patens TaxID=3218 RepID=A0A2K1JBL0_PHYPA|nr:hypothetical protein PHYPA_019188 [Physcomitrium patens]